MKLTRIFALMLALLLVLCACAEKDDDKKSDKKDPEKVVSELEEELAEKTEIMEKLQELYFALADAEEDEFDAVIEEIFGDDADKVDAKLSDEGELILKYDSKTPEELLAEIEELTEELEKAKEELEEEEEEDEDSDEKNQTSDDKEEEKKPVKDESADEEFTEDDGEKADEEEEVEGTPVLPPEEEESVDAAGNPIIVGKNGFTTYTNDYFGVSFSVRGMSLASDEEVRAEMGVEHLTQEEYNEYVYDKQVFQDMIAFDGQNNTVRGVGENIAHAKDLVTSERAYLEIALPGLKSQLASIGVSAEPELATVTVGGVQKDALVTSYSLRDNSMYYLTNFCILKGDHVLTFTVAGTSEANIASMLAGFELF